MNNTTATLTYTLVRSKSSVCLLTTLCPCDSNTHVLIQDFPMMADGKTFKSQSALAIKSINGYSDSANVVTVNDFDKKKSVAMLAATLEHAGVARLSPEPVTPETATETATE